MKTTLKIAVACFIGATIGTFISMGMNPMFWWVGTIAGGLIGYFGYDAKRVIKAIPEAWRTVKKTKVNPDSIKGLILFFAPWLNFFAIAAVVVFLLKPSLPIPNIMAASSIIGMLCWAFSIVFLFAGKMLPSDDSFAENYHNLKYRKYVISFFKFWNPVILPFSLIYWMGAGIIWFIKNAPQPTWQFISSLFRIIHSQARLICGVDSMFGTAIGYIWFHNPIMGGIVGVVLGVINYWVVSIKILKLQPKL